MLVLYSLLVGALFGISVFCFLQASLVRMLFGIMILSSSVNLLIFLMGRMNSFTPAFVDSSHAYSAALANPLSQALILTAIVIGFGLITYTLVLVRCFSRQHPDLNLENSVAED